LNSYAKVLELVTQTHLDEGPYTLAPPVHSSPHSELGDVGRGLRRSWWIIVLCGIIALAAGLEVSNRAATNYNATTYLLLNTSNFQQAVAGGYTASNPLGLQATAIAMLTPSREAKAAEAAGLRPNDNYAVNITSASANSSVLNIKATTDNPRTAAALADAATQQMIDANRETNAETLSSARAAVRTQLQAASRKNKLPLASELNSFQTLEALNDQSMQIIQRALVPSAASKPSKARTGAIALVLGLILGVAIALLRRPRADRV
jgi:uncharacterized protein involved in exopolysaccharide biosynthesis